MTVTGDPRSCARQFGGGGKNAVLERGPTHLWNRSNLVLWEFPTKPARDALIQKIRMREDRFLGQLQSSDGVLATCRRKVLHELIEPIPFLEVVQESLHRNPGARKHHGAAHHLIRTRHQGFW